MKTRKLGPFVLGERFGVLSFYIVWRGRVIARIPPEHRSLKEVDGK